MLRLFSCGLLLASLAYAQAPRGRITKAPAPSTELPQGTSRIEGQIRSLDGQPLTYATVVLNPVQRSGSNPPRQTTTDNLGNYVFKDLMPGHYRVGAEYSGYLRSMFLVDGRQPLGPRDYRPIDLADHTTVTGIDLRLQRETVIAGRIYNADGNPVPKPQLALLQKIGDSEFRNLTVTVDSHEDGTFAIHDLEPGAYFVKALVPGTLKQPAETVYVDTFYPNTERASAALAIELTSASDANVVITLRKTAAFHVRGLTVDGDHKPLEAELGLASLDFTDATQQRILKTKEGAFQFDGVLPGRYFIQAYAMGQRFTARADVLISQHNLDDVTLRLEPVASVRGTVTGPGPDRIFLIPQEPSIAGSLTAIIKNGAYAFDQVPAGSYRASVPARYYIKSVLEPFTVSPGSATTLDIALAEATGEIRGTARDRSQKPHANVRVSAWREGSNDAPTSVTTRPDGTFVIPFVAPGKYFVIAWESVNSALDYIPAFRERFTAGQHPVEVDKTTITVDPLYIPREDSDREAARIP